MEHDHVIETEREYWDLVWIIAPFLPGISVAKTKRAIHYRDTKTGKAKARVKSLQGT